MSLDDIAFVFIFIAGLLGLSVLVKRVGERKMSNREDCVAACEVCAKACEVCLSHCVKVGSPAHCEMHGCCRDCADLCRLCALLLSRGSVFAEDVCKICAAACKACAAECDKHDHECCKACAAACRCCCQCLAVFLFPTVN